MFDEDFFFLKTIYAISSSGSAGSCSQGLFGDVNLIWKNNQQGRKEQAVVSFKGSWRSSVNLNFNGRSYSFSRMRFLGIT